MHQQQGKSPIRDFSNPLDREKKLTELLDKALCMTNENEFLQLICREITVFIDCNVTGIYKYDISSNQFFLVASYEQHINDIIKMVNNDPNTLAGYTFLHDQPIFYEDIKNDQKIAQSPILKLFQVVSGFSCSIKNSYGKWGVFGSMSIEKKKISKGEIDFYEGIARILGLFLEKEAKIGKLLNDYSLETAIQLTSGIAHDFNNYLSIIHNYINLLKEDELKSKKMSETDKIQIINNTLATIDKSEDLIKQIELIGKTRFTKYEKIDVNQIIISMKDIVIQKSKITNPYYVDIEFYLTDDSPILIYGDSSQVSQIIFNLIINAIEAINHEKGKIEVKTEKLYTTNPNNLFEIAFLGLNPVNYVHISVSDDGIGMEKEFINRIFTPYASGKKIKTKSGHNLGLGLSIVYGIVHKMKGTIKVTSEINKGTKFDIFFPCLN